MKGVIKVRGWWKLEIRLLDTRKSLDPDQDPEELSDYTLEHIAEMIKDGYTEGEIIEGDDKNDREE